MQLGINTLRLLKELGKVLKKTGVVTGSGGYGVEWGKILGTGKSFTSKVFLQYFAP